ncbi:50S ribosomal protein L30e [Candidatus Marsarchaeota G2 archaeon OSP_D]|uniref:50S ribosomal protein L30e n=2 Tax=Candidatus Marsarchaeota group 2 TaxID=2203771 RepID=A0A2R6B1N0_9ARCH|nr:MAG: 50S ribosomal protein L30e [Candidatus Marsarchaeota G2 archaeon OSP_D]
MSEVINSLKVAVQTGRVVLGEKETLKGLAKRSVKLVVVSSTAPNSKRLVEEAKKLAVKVYEFPGSGWDLAAVCTRGHVVSALGIVDPGESDILSKLQ